jgi:hypothetical protein
MKLTLRGSVGLERTHDGRLRVIDTAVGTVEEFEMTDEYWERLHELLEGGAEVPDHVGGDFITAGIAVVEARWATNLDERHATALDRPFRYLNDRPDIETGHAIDTLRAAHVVIVGAGGLGSRVAVSLAQCGVGHLTVIDDDVVTAPNLAVSGCYTTSSIGQHKGNVLAEFITSLDVGCDVNVELERVDRPCALIPFARDAQLVIGAANEPSAATVGRIVAVACAETRTAHLIGCGYGHAHSFFGMAVFPGEPPCWLCTQVGVDDSVPLRGPNHIAGVWSPAPAFAAAAITTAACQILLGEATPLHGALTAIDLASLSVIRQEVNDRCSLCQAITDD